MKGLLLKDFYNMKLYIRQYVLLMFLFMVFGVSMKNPNYITWMSLVLGINMGFSTFSFDEAGGYAYMLACPVGRKTIVQAKYLVQFTGAAVIVICSIIGEILNFLSTGEITALCLTQLAGVLGIFFIFASVLVPVSYHYGVEKARVVMLGMVFVPTVVVILGLKMLWIAPIRKILNTISQIFTKEQMISCAVFLFLAFSLLVLAGSYRLSVKIFARREF